MKIRIDNQTFDIDEKTLFDWVKLGRIPPDAVIFSKTLTNGRWQQISGLESFQQIWGDENRGEAGTTKEHALEKDFLAENKFLAYLRKRPTVTYILIAVNIVVFVLQAGLIARSQDARILIQLGAYSHRLIVEDGEYWRLITHTFLHGGSLHLLLNMGILFIVGKLLEGLYGKSRYLILYLFSAIGGSLATLLVVKDALSVGASGAIFGLIGVLVAFGLRYKSQLPRRRSRIFGLRLLPFIAFDILLGFVITHTHANINIFNIIILNTDNININTAAHLGGLIVGFAGGLILTPSIYTNLQREKKAVATCAAALASLVILSGAVTVWHFFTDSEKTVERQMEAALPAPSGANLLNDITRYEKALLNSGYILQYYAELEQLYWLARENWPEDTRWNDKLKEHYERALVADPNNADWNNHLLVLYGKTAFESSHEMDELEGYYIKLCETVARERGYHQMLYVNLEYFYMRAKALAPQQESSWNRKLEELYHEAIAEDPENPTWNNNLAWFYVEGGMVPQKAVELAQQAVEHAPKKTTFLDTLAWAYLRNGQYRKALRTFEQVFLIPPQTEEDPPARESGWKGITELVQADIAPQKLREFDQAFLNFYNRLSHQFGSDTDARARLEAVFDLFQAHHKG